jgi:hypothetical protein
MDFEHKNERHYRESGGGGEWNQPPASAAAAAAVAVAVSASHVPDIGGFADWGTAAAAITEEPMDGFQWTRPIPPLDGSTCWDLVDHSAAGVAAASSSSAASGTQTLADRRADEYAMGMLADSQWIEDERRQFLPSLTHEDEAAASAAAAAAELVDPMAEFAPAFSPYSFYLVFSEQPLRQHPASETAAAAAAAAGAYTMDPLSAAAAGPGVWASGGWGRLSLVVDATLNGVHIERALRHEPRQTLQFSLTQATGRRIPTAGHASLLWQHLGQGTGPGDPRGAVFMCSEMYYSLDARIQEALEERRRDAAGTRKRHRMVNSALQTANKHTAAHQAFLTREFEQGRMTPECYAHAMFDIVSSGEAMRHREEAEQPRPEYQSLTLTRYGLRCDILVEMPESVQHEDQLIIHTANIEIQPHFFTGE